MKKVKQYNISDNIETDVDLDMRNQTSTKV